MHETYTMSKTILCLFCLLTAFTCFSQKLHVVEQDYENALRLASDQDKLIFIDFYTSWCAPCKVLDKQIFQNDSMKQVLAKDFILLKYDAEKDKEFHLSKKHHVSSYPTAIILNKDGYVINREYGFSGEDFQSLSKSVTTFTQESIGYNDNGETIAGYANTINIENYPTFYIDFVNRDNIKYKDNPEFAAYWNTPQDVLSEEYFSTLLYFASNVPEKTADLTLESKEKYLNLYGTTDTETLFFFLASGKINTAVAEKDETKFNEAIAYTKRALPNKWTDDLIPMYKTQLLKAQGKWMELYKINKEKEREGGFSKGAVNYFCWDVYKNCDDSEVIDLCVSWMEQVTSKHPSFHYLDTYAHLLFKSGNKVETEKIIKETIRIGEKENEKTDHLKSLLDKF